MLERTIFFNKEQKKSLGMFWKFNKILDECLTEEKNTSIMEITLGSDCFDRAGHFTETGKISYWHEFFKQFKQIDTPKNKPEPIEIVPKPASSKYNNDFQSANYATHRNEGNFSARTHNTSNIQCDQRLKKESCRTLEDFQALTTTEDIEPNSTIVILTIIN